MVRVVLNSTKEDNLHLTVGGMIAAFKLFKVLVYSIDSKVWLASSNLRCQCNAVQGYLTTADTSVYAYQKCLPQLGIWATICSYGVGPITSLRLAWLTVSNYVQYNLKTNVYILAVENLIPQFSIP